MSARPNKPGWYKQLPRPIQLIVDERIAADGFAGEPDAWIASILITAKTSPQGFVLRLSLKREAAKLLSQESIADLELFGKGDADDAA